MNTQIPVICIIIDRSPPIVERKQYACKLLVEYGPMALVQGKQSFPKKICPMWRKTCLTDVLSLPNSLGMSSVVWWLRLLRLVVA